MNIQNKRILAIAPHIDDVELGAGGTIHRLATENDIFYLGLSRPPKVNKQAFMAEFWLSACVLGLQKKNVVLHEFDPRDLASDRARILQLFYDFNQTYRPDVVLVPNSDDVHQSHQLVHQEAKRVFKHTTLLGYELPWNNFSFSADVFIELSEQNLEAKQQALSCFSSQQERTFFNNNVVLDNARFRGKQIDKAFCECFELVRLVV